jgi:hypothetical protein
MLYKINLECKPLEALEPVPFKDIGQYSRLEKDLENILTANLFDVLFEEAQLFPIFQERPLQAEADIYAVNSTGDLVIFEIKRGVAGADAVEQILRYAQNAGTWSYQKLEDRYCKFTGKSAINCLRKDHMEAFQLEEMLEPKQFNQKQHLRVIGSAADESLVQAVDYWKRQGISIDFLPYRIFEISNQLYFEFFSLPYDRHINPGNIKAVIFDTNASWDEKSVWDMIENNKVAAYGDAKRFARYIFPRDIVFYSHVGKGIIAAAEVSSDVLSNGEDELYHEVKFLTSTPKREHGIQKAVPFADVNRILGKSFFWARTIKVPYLSRDEAQILLEALKECLGK